MERLLNRNLPPESDVSGEVLRLDRDYSIEEIHTLLRGDLARRGFRPDHASRNAAEQLKDVMAACTICDTKYDTTSMLRLGMWNEQPIGLHPFSTCRPCYERVGRDGMRAAIDEALNRKHGK